MSLLLLMFVIAGCYTNPSSDESNSIQFLKNYYGVDDADIAALAQKYGVEVSDISHFGPDPFPMNYILHQIGWKNNQTGKSMIYRRQLELIVKGYISQCERDNSNVLYLFYSNRLAGRSMFDRHASAFVMEVVYKPDPKIHTASENQILDNISYYDWGDSSRQLDWKAIAPTCIPPALTK